MPDHNDTLELSAHSQAVAQALEWLESIAERQDWAPRATFGLTLCLDEALTNVMSYAFQPPAAAQPAIMLACNATGGHIVLELRDNGRPYDPTTEVPPPLATCLDDAVPGGHGLRLMRHYLEDLHYQRQGDWNCLTMIMPLS